MSRVLPNGAVVVSLDTELRWGYYPGDPGKHLSTDGVRERNIIDLLLEVFEDAGAPVTWAIVGHLFLDHCDGEHRDLQAPVTESGDSWYDQDPGTTLSEDPLSYGPDVVDAIRNAAVDHEIATHTFSHVTCTAVTAGVVADELQACRSLAHEAGVEVSTLVFPRNEVDHLETVREHGIEVYRGRSEEALRRREQRWGGVRRYGRFLLNRPPSLVTPAEVLDGLWGLPTSQYLAYPSPDSPLNRVHRLLPSHPAVARAKKGINRAKQTGKVLHLWGHPHDFTTVDIENLQQILREANRQSVPVKTMRGVVSEFRDSRQDARQVSP